MPSLSNTPLILPDYATTEEAFQVPLVLAAPGNAASVNYSPKDGYVEVVTLATAQYVTDGTAGNRAANIRVLDQNGVALAFLPPAALQGPSTSLNYLWLRGFANALGTATTNQVNTLPDIVLLPNYTFQIQNAGPGPTDHFVAPVLYVQRYPTDAFQRDQPAALVPTPIML